MRVVAVAAALGAALFRGAAAVSVDVENGVYRLEESSFDTVVNKFPAVLVKFHAPWCGHCKAMQKDFEKAARSLKKLEEGGAPPTARLAKVDATVETNLAAKYQVQGFPTLIVFKDGQLFDTYRGGRDKDDIVNYMSTMSSPPALGLVLRAYYAAKSPYKEIIRAIPVIPPQLRKYFFAAFPLVCAYPFLMLAFCWVCCSSGSRKSRPPTKAGKNRKRSSTPTRSAKEGEAAGSDDKKKDEAAKDDGKDKDEQEKKED